MTPAEKRIRRYVALGNVATVPIKEAAALCDELTKARRYGREWKYRASAARRIKNEYRHAAESSRAALRTVCLGLLQFVAVGLGQADGDGIQAVADALRVARGELEQ